MGGGVERERERQRHTHREKVPNRSRPAFHQLGKEFVKEKKEEKKRKRKRKKQVQFLNCTLSVMFPDIRMVEDRLCWWFVNGKNILLDAIL